MCAPWSHSPRCLSSSGTARSQARTHSSERARREHNALQRTLDLMGKEDRGSPVLIFPSNPSARSAGENSLLKESFRLQPDHRKNCVYPERALDLGNTGGNRANPSPTRPPDLCAIPVISLTAVPQQQRDWEIIGADTLLGACPAGRWIWWERKIGDHPS